MHNMVNIEGAWVMWWKLQSPLFLRFVQIFSKILGGARAPLDPLLRTPCLGITFIGRYRRSHLESKSLFPGFGMKIFDSSKNPLKIFLTASIASLAVLGIAFLQPQPLHFLKFCSILGFSLLTKDICESFDFSLSFSFVTLVLVSFTWVQS